MNDIFCINEYCSLKINKIILLNDNKIVACADDGNIYIYVNSNKDKEYYYFNSCIKITDVGKVRDIIEMDDGNIIVCGEEGSINIIKISKSNAFYVTN